MIAFLRKLTGYFDEYDIPYMLSGSVAMSLYTEPRFTRDYDFIVHLRLGDVQTLVENFSDGYYCDADSINEAVRNKSMFNIIDYQSGYKADFVILRHEEYRQTEFARRKKIQMLDMQLYVVSPEDLLLSKLIWIQELQSGVQMDDIELLSKYHELDWKYISDWIDKMNLNTFGLLQK